MKKELSLISAALLMFGLINVASANNADQVIVSISYPCAQGENPCDETGVAVSRDVGGDVVNVYITLLDANGNPATAGPGGESLSSLNATISSTLAHSGNMTPNVFASVVQTVSFGGDPNARAKIDYTGATPGTDQIVVSVDASPTPKVGSANVNVVAVDANGIVTRTLDTIPAPSTIYETVLGPQNNDGNTVRAGNAVAVTVIAHVDGLYTPAPNLEGHQVRVRAYADYSENGTAGGRTDISGYESTAIATGTGTFQNGKTEVSLQIDNAGPDRLNVVFTATTEDSNGDIIETPRVAADSEVALYNFFVDTVTMNPLTAPSALLIGSDPYKNGNLIIEEDCFAVLDDAGAGNGTAVNITVALVDSLGNAVRSSGVTAVNADFGIGSVLDDQLGECGNWDIAGGNYARTCSLYDDNSISTGSVISGPLTLSNTVTADYTTINLLPATAPGVLDLTLTIDKAGENISAGDKVVLTLDSAGTYSPVVNGDVLVITALSSTNGPQLLSSGSFASATTTLQVVATDADNTTDGVQIEVNIFGPCTTTAAQNVTFTVKNASRCNVSENASVPIADIDPDVAAILAVVELASGVETASTLDGPAYVGTNPIVIDTAFIADGTTINDLLDDAGEVACDLQLWDQYNNVVDDQPGVTCSSQSGLGIITVDACNVSVKYVSAAVGITDTITCSSVDAPDVAARRFNITSILAEPAEEASEAATALVVRQEGPQLQSGTLINPQPGGEAIIRVGANGTLSAARNVSISFDAGSVAGAQLRTLNSTTALPIPFYTTLSPPLIDKRLVVYAPAAGAVIINVTDQGSPPLRAASLTLNFGAACVVTCIAGRITVDPSGEPIGGVPVEVVDSNGNYLSYAWSDSDGHYTANGLATGDYYLRTSNDQGYLDEWYQDAIPGKAPAPVHVDAPNCTYNIDFALGKGGCIAGRIVDTTGAPIPDVEVNVGNDSGPRYAWSDSDGHYTVNGLATGDYYVLAMNDQGYIVEWYQDAVPMEGDPAPVHVDAPNCTYNIDFALEKGGCIAGRVTVDPSGEPIGNVEIDVHESTGKWTYYIPVSDAEGYYTANGLATGDYYVQTVNDQGYIDEWYQNAIPGEAPAPVQVDAPNCINNINFALEKGVCIAGRITVDPSGEPIGGVPVEVVDSNGNYLSYAWSDSDGHYTANGLATGVYYVQTRNYQGYLGEWYQNAIPGEAPAPVHVDAPNCTYNIDFVLEKGGSVAGTITCENCSGGQIVVFALSEKLEADFSNLQDKLMGLVPFIGYEALNPYSIGPLPYDTPIWVYACCSQQFNFPPESGDYFGSYESNPVNLTKGNPDLTGIDLRLKEFSTITTTTIKPPSTTTTTLQPTTTTTSIAPECSENADCNDGLYCNGIETCVDGACERGADPCTAGEVCIEETDTCELATRIEASTNAFGSLFFFLPGFVTIKGTGTDFTLFGSIINYEPAVLFKGVKVVNPLTQTITQFVIVLPSLLPNVPPYPATITVTVDGLSDDMEINAFPF